MRYKLIVVGASYGGWDALNRILPGLGEDFPVPLVIVEHLSPDNTGHLLGRLDSGCRIRVKEADEKEELKPATAYFAPADYHLLVEDDLTVSLSVEQRVSFSRPSIDVLFESAAYAIRERLVGIILTGANTDGLAGIKKIKEYGGLTIAQSPETALSPIMPQGAIDTGAVDHILPLDEIAAFVTGLFFNNKCEGVDA